MRAWLQRFNPCHPESEGNFVADMGYVIYSALFKGDCPCCAFYRGAAIGLTLGIAVTIGWHCGGT